MIDNSINEVIILAGGKGTRLKNIVPNKQKVLANVKGKPFIFYILDMLVEQKFKKVILSVGYHHAQVIDAVTNAYHALVNIKFSIEKKPLGTGGALKKAINHIDHKNFLAINGDSFNDILLDELSRFHLSNDNNVSMLLKRVKDVNRYGSVKIDNDGNIQSFQEKKDKGHDLLINAGIYAFKAEVLKNFQSDVFSLENELLPGFIGRSFMGLLSDKTFIDIGVPDDYKKAQAMNFGRLRVDY